jgi:hypothetical protein
MARTDTATTTDERQQVIIRLAKGLVKELDHIAVDAEEYRQQTIERLLREAVRWERERKQGSLELEEARR